MARERYHEDNVYPAQDKDIITSGGSGFGLMAMIVGIERGFVERGKALERLDKILTFLENTDRFHGAWPHWLNPDGSVYPFSLKDDGGDIVETAFLAQGLLTFRQYLDPDKADEMDLIQRIQTLWEGIEWSWYTQDQDVLYWHWSPNYGWEMNFPIGGYNEALILYVLAAASPTYPINRDVYDKGWARSGRISESVTYYGLDTELDHFEHDVAPVGPLFWAHYSFLGLNPKGLTDSYADYWKLNENHARIHYRYCLENPQEHEGYGENMWGLTSSYSLQFYAAHRPGDDPGVISPTAALSSMPYTPDESINMLRQLYSAHDSLIGQFGPYDALSFEHDWYVPRYLAIDQGPIPVMIENHRSGLLWDLFMGNEDVKRGLRSLGFQSPYLED
ncbi:MAG: beta-glucosidase [Eudoraea sp.]|nr:beta-glucosidase [Eudoraea sp.]